MGRLPALRPYRVVDWSVESGTPHLNAVAIAAVLKSNTPENPYCLANEFVSMALGRYLRLPVPPGVIIADGDNTYFASLDFNWANQQFSGIEPSEFSASFPDYVPAILAFDVFICNADRNEFNVYADYSEPATFYPFDHSGLLGTDAGRALEHMAESKDALVINGDTRGQPHCLLGRMQDKADFDHFIARIEQLPDYLITETVEAVSGLGIIDTEAQALTELLLDRRFQLRRLIAEKFDGHPSPLAGSR